MNTYSGAHVKDFGSAGKRSVLLATQAFGAFPFGMSDSVENARRFLENLQRPDLSKLLAFSEVDTDVGEWFDTIVTIRSHTIDGAQALLSELIVHQQTMIDVGTGNASIQDVNDYYLARERRIGVLCSANGVPYESPHDDLRSWFDTTNNTSGRMLSADSTSESFSSLL